MSFRLILILSLLLILPALYGVKLISDHASEKHTQKAIIDLDGLKKCLSLEKGRDLCYAELCEYEPGYLCAEDILETITALEGPKIATETLYELTSRFRINDDHQLAHTIGRSTAKHFGITSKAFARCPLDFAYGCVHGFFEDAIAKTSLKEQEKVLTTICETYDDAEAFGLFKKGNCYHGGGHGIMMNEGYGLKKALKICEKLQKGVQSHCWSGVFMENVLAFLGNRIPEEKITFKDDDLLAPCNTFDSDIYRSEKERECWLFQHEYLIVHHSLTFYDLKKICLEAKNAEGECFQGLSRNFMGKYYSNILNDVFQKPTKKSKDNNIFIICNLYPKKFIPKCHDYAIHYSFSRISPEEHNSLEETLQKTSQYCFFFNDRNKRNRCFEEIERQKLHNKIHSPPLFGH